MIADVRSPMKYVGGKFMSAERIIRLFPAPSLYDRYIEPCLGAGHIFFAKERCGHEEIVGDLYDALVNFWWQVRDHGAEVAKRLPPLYSRKLYYECYHSFADPQLDPIERAARWFYALRGTGTGWMRRSPVGWNSLVGNARAYDSLRETFEDVQQRLRGVVIENRDALWVIKKHAVGKRVLVYVDPPYIGAEHYYHTPPFDHAGLAALLNSLNCYVALSYYQHEQLDALYPADKWRRITWEQHKPASIGTEDEDRQTGSEMLLCNYADEAPVPSLWD